jgi:hypothetical protein
MDYFAMQTFFGSVKKRRASSPPSRPTALCFMPTLQLESAFAEKRLPFSTWEMPWRHQAPAQLRSFLPNSVERIFRAVLARNRILIGSRYSTSCS